MANLRLRQVRSTIGCTRSQRDTVRTLGLKRVDDVVVKPDRAELRGMLASIPHLVEFQQEG